MTATPTETRLVDDWELRCRYNWHRCQLPALLQAGVLTKSTKRIGNADPKAGLPSGTKSVEVFYHETATKSLVLKYHQYILPNDKPKGDPDPKRLKIGNVLYRRFKGDDDAMRDPQLLVPDGGFGLWRWTYRFLRKAACRLRGPDKDSQFAAKSTRWLRDRALHGKPGGS